MTSTDTDAIGVVEDSQRLENLVVVGKWFAPPMKTTLVARSPKSLDT